AVARAARAGAEAVSFQLVEEADAGLTFPYAALFRARGARVGGAGVDCRGRGRRGVDRPAAGGGRAVVAGRIARLELEAVRPLGQGAVARGARAGAEAGSVQLAEEADAGLTVGEAERGAARGARISEAGGVGEGLWRGGS